MSKNKRTIIVTLCVILTITSLIAGAFGLEWTGIPGSGAAGTVGGLSNAEQASLYGDGSDPVAGYRVSVVQNQGGKGVTVGKPGKPTYVNIMRNNNSDCNVNKTKSTFLTAYGDTTTMYNKYDWLARYGTSNFKFSSVTYENAKNTFIIGDNISGFTGTLGGTTTVGAFMKDGTNLNIILDKLGYKKGYTELPPNSKVIVEPIINLKVDGTDVMITVSDMGVYGIAKVGYSKPTKQNWEAWWYNVANWTNNTWCHLLEIPAGLWNVTATRTTSRSDGTDTTGLASFPEMVQRGFGMGYVSLPEVTVTFNANGHGTAPAAQTVVSGGKAVKPADLSATGYTFGGWYTNAACTTKWDFASAVTSNLTLYAKWTSNTFTVSYNANGGSGAPSSQTKTYGVDLTLSNTKPTRTGHTFAGWNTASNGSGTNYSAGGKYTSNADVTLYAQWTSENSYRVQINLNGGSQAHAANSSYNGSSNVFYNPTSVKYSQWMYIDTPTRTGYTFAGWNISGMDDTTHQYWANSDSHSFTGTSLNGTKYNEFIHLRATSGTVTFDAQWIENSYDVKINLNGGSQAHPANSSYNGSSNEVYNPTSVKYSQWMYIDTPTRTGYTFAGWNITGMDDTTHQYWANSASHDFTGTSLNGTKYNEFIHLRATSGTVTFDAQWIENSYDVKINLNGGSQEHPANSSYNGSSNELCNPTSVKYSQWMYIDTPTRTGYTFAGWNITGMDSNYHQYWANSASHDFTGTSLNGTKYNEFILLRATSGTVTFTANWKPITYTVTYDANGGTDAPDDQFKSHGINLQLSSVVPVRHGYTFGCWKVETSEGPEYYHPGDIYTRNEPATLVALWQSGIEIVGVEPNAVYHVGQDVITTYIVYNHTDQDIVPDDGVKVRFSAAALGHSYNSQEITDIVIPAGDSNIYWFRWSVPEGIPSNVLCKGIVYDADGELLSNDTLNCTTGTVENYQTPDTQFERQKPISWVMPATPAATYTNASWYQWEYEDGAFTKQVYGVHLKGNIEIMPDTSIGSSVNSGGIWTMRSGYGYTMSWNIEVEDVGTTHVIPSMVTPVQSAYALFPEFGYRQAVNQCRLLELVDGTWQFKENPYADDPAARLHFTPIWFPDGTQNYKAAGFASDCWTPAGMISLRGISNGVTVSGSLYDDWYIGRFPG